MVFMKKDCKYTISQVISALSGGSVTENNNQNQSNSGVNVSKTNSAVLIDGKIQLSNLII